MSRRSDHIVRECRKCRHRRDKENTTGFVVGRTCTKIGGPKNGQEVAGSDSCPYYEKE